MGLACKIIYLFKTHNEMYKVKKLFFLGLILIFTFSINFFTGCDTYNERVPTTLSDSRFNGEFWHYGTGTSFSCYEFNGTNKVKMSHNSYHYIYDISISTAEFQISNGKYRYRVWDDDANYEGRWIQDWANYNFSVDGNTLNLDMGDGLTMKMTKNN